MSFKKYVHRNVEQRLGPIPTYAITSSSGGVYFSGDGRTVHYYLDYEDALQALLEFKLVQGQVFENAVIRSKSLHSVLKDALRNPYPDNDQGERMTKLVPSTRAVAQAGFMNEFGSMDLSSEVKKNLKGGDDLKYKKRRAGHCRIPCFEAKGLYRTRKGEEHIVPLFMSFEDLEVAWAKKHQCNEDPNAPPQEMTYRVHDLVGILDVMKKPDQPYGKFDLRRYGIVADSKSIAAFEQDKSRGSKVKPARLHVRM